MKIGELNMHCGECSLIDHCDEPFSEIAICMEERLADVDEDIFFRYLETSKLPNRDTPEEKQAVIDDVYEKFIREKNRLKGSMTVEEAEEVARRKRNEEKAI